ncbi:MAG: FkbM family methyltransferase [bacterium]|nr:FkbM family methyltransferase [bacterium]
MLLHIFESIGTGKCSFVEFGAKDGLAVSNTANLRLNHGWTGLLLDAAASDDDPLVKRAFVTAENINDLFAEHGVPERLDLLSIDIDGNDYWVWKALDRFTPRVVVVEYNIFFRPDDARTMPYDPDHVWQDDSCYHGASLAALRKLGNEKGYALVHTDSWAPNAFFVLRSELPENYLERPNHELTDWRHFHEPPGTDGKEWTQV